MLRIQLFIVQQKLMVNNLDFYKYIYIILIQFYISLDTIRYLSLHDNKYIRYYQGHEKK
jgi:hypothetical protein